MPSLIEIGRVVLEKILKSFVWNCPSCFTEFFKKFYQFFFVISFLSPLGEGRDLFWTKLNPFDPGKCFLKSLVNLVVMQTTTNTTDNGQIRSENLNMTRPFQLAWAEISSHYLLLETTAKVKENDPCVHGLNDISHVSMVT